MFVGVVSSESRLNNYVGSDRSGWGYLANKAIWHNKGKVRTVVTGALAHDVPSGMDMAVPSGMHMVTKIARWASKQTRRY